MSEVPKTMIRIFYGDDRVKLQAGIRKIFGEEYEVIEGEELTLNQAKDVFYGTSIFGERKIVVRDLSENKEIFAKLGEFLNAPNNVILWESKLDKRTTAYKELAASRKVEMKEFRTIEPPRKNIVFDIYETALWDGPRAVKMLEEIEAEQEPLMFMGLLVSQAIRKFEQRPGRKEKRALEELSKTDMLIKTTFSQEPWQLLKSFLLRVSSL